MSFEELTARLHAVMDEYKISHRNDITFLANVAWIFGINVDFKLVPIEPSSPTGSKETGE